MPGTDTAIRMAEHRGYEAVLLTIVVIACLLLVGVLIRWLMKSQDARYADLTTDKNRLENRVSELEKFVETTMLEQVRQCTMAIQSNTAAVETLNKALDNRPCMLDHEKQTTLIQAIAMEAAKESSEARQGR